MNDCSITSSTVAMLRSGKLSAEQYPAHNEGLC